jgi:general L-amino acid transport system substrate-binding protein
VRAGALLLAAATLAPPASPARADGVIDRVRAAGAVRCGAEERPGIAAPTPDGRMVGLAVDLCRAVGVAVLGPGGRIVFRVYGSDRDFDAVRQGGDDLFFLTGDAIAEHALAAAILPGPTVFIERIALMVPDSSAVRGLGDLDGRAICLMIGSEAQRALEEAAERQHVTFARLSFSEDAEMLDAYDVQRCQAVVGEATQLAAMRRAGGVNRLRSRFLREPLALSPMIAATSVSDARWSALVAWVMDALILHDAPSSGWRATAPPLRGRLAGLRPDWQSDVLAETGGYGAMVRRNLVDGLCLDPGPNAPWPAGLLLPPAAE